MLAQRVACVCMFFAHLFFLLVLGDFDLCRSRFFLPVNFSAKLPSSCVFFHPSRKPCVGMSFTLCGAISTACASTIHLNLTGENSVLYRALFSTRVRVWACEMCARRCVCIGVA
ncbi:unnamed protein product [Pylaiella littoralis]